MTTLLIVEDNILLATTLVRFLNNYGKMKVTTIAPSAELALGQLCHKPVDLVLVDVALPGMSGIDLIAILHKRYPQLPCLVVSAHSEGDYVRRALNAGAKGYVLKGDPLAILAAISKVLAGETYISAEVRSKIPQ